MNESIRETLTDAAPEFDSKLIPVMRQAVTLVQMLLFRCLKDDLQQRHQDWPEQKNIRLAGAVVNNLYGTEAADQQVNLFAREHRPLIEEELRCLRSCAEELIPHITDSLRMQTICDNHEGIHSIPNLLLAREIGLLDEERPLPMPSTFMQSVRQLGADAGLVRAMEAAGVLSEDEQKE
jgi:hypothetical protein